MTAIKSTGAPRGSVLLAFGVHLKTTVQAPVEHMGTVGICPHLLLADKKKEYIMSPLIQWHMH